MLSILLGETLSKQSLVDALGVDRYGGLWCGPEAHDRASLVDAWKPELER